MRKSLILLLFFSLLSFAYSASDYLKLDHTDTGFGWGGIGIIYLSAEVSA
jgi:hypothetical protein